MPVAPSCNRALAAASASSRLSTMCPRGTATPYFERMAFAWYSCIFIFYDCGERTAPLLRLGAPDCLLLRGLHKSNETGDCIGRSAAVASAQRTAYKFRVSSVIGETWL